VLVLDMIEILPPLGKYKYDTWRVLSVKCYIYSSVRLWSCIQNVNTNLDEGKRNGEGGKISGQMSPFIGEGEREGRPWSHTSAPDGRWLVGSSGTRHGARNPAPGRTHVWRNRFEADLGHCSTGPGPIH
jgi:hypothetical protein